MRLFAVLFCILCLTLHSDALNSARHRATRQNRHHNPADVHHHHLPDCGPVDGAPRAHVRNGTYHGLHSPEYNQDFFLGMPFAQPPVGDLRLRIPASLNASWEGLRNATAYSPACYGYGEDTLFGAGNFVSEDCLSINVVRPSGYEHKRLPVAFWIYGGGFYEGSNRDPRYNLSFIVEQSVQIGKPIIGVSINYRLSWFGWLYSQDVLDAGIANLGLRDQRLALQWVQENIEAFGGDPRKVTIWGESAGAMSVGLHILAYNGRDDHLFHGAVAESGDTTGLGMINPTVQDAEKIYQKITQRAGCESTTEKLDCLRKAPVEKLNHIFNTTLAEGFYEILVGPLVDGDIIARGGIDQMVDGDFVKVPYILGENADDGTDFIPFGLNTDEDVHKFYKGWGFNDDQVDTLMRLYPNDPANTIPLSVSGFFNSTIGHQWKRAATISGDLGFKSVRRLCSRLWTKHTDVPLYSFRFNAIPNGIPDYFGVTHWQEVPFVFHNTMGVGFPNIDPPYFGPDPLANRSQSFFDLADLMSRMWAAFFHEGNPNFEGQKAIHWPTYTLENPNAYVFDANVSSHIEQDTYRATGMDYMMEQYLGKNQPWVLHDHS